MANRGDGSGWFLRSGRDGQVKLRLFCFPYAGGTGTIYRNWIGQFSPSVEVIPVELPGRGKRLTEPLIRNIPALIEALTPAIIPLLEGRFAFFGHSMGAIIAFELARELRRRNAPQPAQLLVSGRRAPQMPSSARPIYNLPEDEFRAELLRLNGTPVEVLEHAELMSLLLPLLRADFELIQTYEYSDDAPLTCPITVYGGVEDHEVPREVLAPWEQQTTARFSLHMLPGDHFFLRSASRLLLHLLERELRPLMAAR